MSFPLKGFLLLASVASAPASIISISETNGDAGKASVIEPTGSSNGSLFGEDAFALVDRNHEYNGTAFDSTGKLTTGAGTDPAIASVTGLPAYLVGNPYIANAIDNRDNANYSLTINVDIASYIYLLIDNRVGDGNNKDMPTLGSAMAWVADMGFALVNTGLSPNGQPDFLAMDQGPFTNVTLDTRSHAAVGLGTGPGISVDQFFSVYEKQITSTITLGDQNDGTTRNMYGVVVTPVPEPSMWGLMGLALGYVLALRRRASHFAAIGTWSPLRGALVFIERHKK